MKHKGSYIFSFVLAVLVHVGAIGLLLMNWESSSLNESAKVDKPYYIAAYTQAENPIKAKQAREKNAAKTLRDKKRRDRIKKDADKKALLNRQRLEAERVRLAAEQKALEEASRLAADKQDDKPEPESQVDDELRLALEQELDQAIRAEQDARIAITEDEKAQAFATQIRREIIRNWSRPPSARNGMQAILRVFLVPTGEVVNVLVQESSGNDAFDRSARLAVEKSGQFIVPKDNRQFERNFREFEVLFRPEDLRL